MRPEQDGLPVFLFQVWHLMLAAAGLVAVAGFALGTVPVGAALGGLAVVVLVALVGSRRARAA